MCNITLVSIMRFKVILEPQREGVFVAYVPAFPGCVSQGETREEALQNIKEALTFYLEVLEEVNMGKELRRRKPFYSENQVVEVSL